MFVCFNGCLPILIDFNPLFLEPITFYQNGVQHGDVHLTPPAFLNHIFQDLIHVFLSYESLEYYPGEAPKATVEIHNKAFSPSEAKAHYEKALKMFGDDCDGMRAKNNGNQK